MDGREGMALSGPAIYYLQRGNSGSGMQTGLHAPTGFRTLSFPYSSVQTNVRDTYEGSTYQAQNPSPNFPYGINMGAATSVPPVEPAKRKRGRPRKYSPGGANMSLAVSPSSLTPSSKSITPTPRRARGRPPGSGWKQRLAPLGEWMNSSAGLAFTPHLINIAVGEDIATKILSFSQQRPRAVCIMSASGAVSMVALRQPTPSGSTVTYKGRFEILCLSGSYLLAENGDRSSRTGGLSVSLCSPDGHVIGGGVGGMLIAGSPVQVFVCSFVYGGLKTTNKNEAGSMADSVKNSTLQPGEKSTMIDPIATQNPTLNSLTCLWPGSGPDLRNPNTEIDLMRG